METRASRSSSKGLLGGSEKASVLSPNVQRVVVRENSEKASRKISSSSKIANGNGENMGESFSDSNEELSTENEVSPVTGSPPTKEQEERIGLILRALNYWDKKLEGLFTNDAWMQLISEAVKGTPDARKYKNSDRLRKFAQVVIEQIASPAFQNQVARKIASLCGGSNVVVKDFLELCGKYEVFMTSKRWKDTQGEDCSSTMEEDNKLGTSLDGFVTDDSIQKDDRVLDAAEFSKLSDNGEDDDFQEEKENSLRDDVSNTRTLRAKRNKTSSIKKRSAVVERTNHQSNETLNKNVFRYIRPRTNTQRSVSTSHDNAVIDPLVNNKPTEARLSPLMLDDEIIENPTPPATPLSDNNDGPSPEKKSRKDSDEIVMVNAPVETKRLLRRCGNGTIIGKTGRIDRQTIGFDYFQAVEEIEAEKRHKHHSSGGEEVKNTSPPQEQDKENLPKSPEEIARSYPKPPNCPDLTPSMFQELKECLAKPSDEVAVDKFGLKIKTRDLSLYDKPEWLDDANIDFYLELIKERNLKRDDYPNVYIFRCYFYKILERQGYEDIKGATDNDNIFAHDIVMVPIHSKDHWVLIVMDTRQKTLTCYDSMDHDNIKSIKHVQDYFINEWERLKNARNNNRRTKRAMAEAAKLPRELFPEVIEGETVWERSGWKVRDLGMNDIPQQQNGRDCGIFLLQFAEYLSRDVVFDFEQRHTAYFRKRMMYETLKRSLLID